MILTNTASYLRTALLEELAVLFYSLLFFFML